MYRVDFDKEPKREDLNCHVGIDPGKSGGIGFIGIGTKSRSIVYVEAMPFPVTGKDYNWKMFADVLISVAGHFNQVLVTIEQQWSRPETPKKTAVSLMGAYEGIKAVCEALTIPYEIVSPQKWKNRVIPKRRKSEKKQASINFCRRRFPNVSLLKSDRSKVAHDGMAEGLCIAYYGTRLWDQPGQ